VERQTELSMAGFIGGGIALASFSVRLIGGETAQRFFDAALDATLFRSVAHRVQVRTHLNVVLPQSAPLPLLPCVTPYLD